ncbi:hypothetical protein BaRGS_00037659 [Batillaria attramentaria]|uniref:Uncharacterized protein n=1 Tax=Batillaria attramentaria TaxID=370345 RepID=A0ABD0J8A6_9CAEN
MALINAADETTDVENLVHPSFCPACATDDLCCVGVKLCSTLLDTGYSVDYTTGKTPAWVETATAGSAKEQLDFDVVAMEIITPIFDAVELLGATAATDRGQHPFQPKQTTIFTLSGYAGTDRAQTALKFMSNSCILKRRSLNQHRSSVKLLRLAQNEKDPRRFSSNHKHFQCRRALERGSYFDNICTVLLAKHPLLFFDRNDSLYRNESFSS